MTRVSAKSRKNYIFLAQHGGKVGSVARDHDEHVETMSHHHQLAAWCAGRLVHIPAEIHSDALENKPEYR